MFSQAALSFGPRRHHCRLCGFIFCNTHSVGRMPLQTGDHQRGHRIAMSRVCDGCFATTEDGEDVTIERRFSDATPSLASSDASAKDDVIAEPISRSQSASSLNEQAPPKPSLAPIEAWMDRSGILSLYPLAVQSSHSRSASRSANSSPVTSRSVAPLFAPTIAERRSAHDMERKRLSLRRTRNVRLWVSTPVGSGDEAEAEAQPDSPSKANASGTCTPQERERELDWSTF
jgi:hypothetical protein